MGDPFEKDYRMRGVVRVGNERVWIFLRHHDFIMFFRV